MYYSLTFTPSFCEDVIYLLVMRVSIFFWLEVRNTCISGLYLCDPVGWGFFFLMSVAVKDVLFIEV